MRRSGGAASARVGRGWAWAAAFASPFVLYLIIRHAAVALSPPMAATLPPRSVLPIVRVLAASSVHPAFKPTDQMGVLVTSAAIRSPLAFEPFLLRGMIAEREGRLKDATLLLEESRRRRPHFLLTRMQLMALYGRTGQYGPMLAEMNFTLRASKEVRAHLLPELAKLITDLEARRALAEMLATDPEWRGEFYDAAIKSPPLPEHALSLMDLVRDAGANDISPERNFYLRSLISDGRYREARELWLSTYPQKNRADHILVFNGQFQNIQNVEPFGWELYDIDVGRAAIVSEKDSPPYLEVLYYGGKNAVLADQLLALPPGNYQLNVIASKDQDVSTEGTYWTVFCQPGGAELVKLELGNVASAATAINRRFSVPATGCEGQQLRLIAQAGDAPVASALRVLRIGIAREN
jgi:hypothetical protein